MTAPEFLKSKIGDYNSFHPFLEGEIDYEDIEKWLEDYAEQQAIAFQKWTRENHYTYDIVGWFLLTDDVSIYFSEKDLYQLFLKDQTKIP